jgi:8-oxo-dGTP pyrophosphatase MutT (NUDIX family)
LSFENESIRRKAVINLPASKRDLAVKADRQQVGALCIRRRDNGAYQVLLVTSRDTGRWIIPKGWPAKRLKDHEAAAREAREEAGVSGKVKSRPIGTYTYPKIDDTGARPLRVEVFLLSVRRERRNWRERDQRRRAWFHVHEAAREVGEPELRTLIRGIGQRSATR